MATSADPYDRPLIKPNYLAEAADIQVALAGLRMARKIFTQPAFAELSAGEILPGPQAGTDEAMIEHIRATGASIFHPVGTCKMGEDPLAVVDSRLRVRGMTGLRVIDASIMPAVTTGNTNAPTIMIAEKGASMIREDWKAKAAA